VAPRSLANRLVVFFAPTTDHLRDHRERRADGIGDFRIGAAFFAHYHHQLVTSIALGATRERGA
jgi:hypothetical protein